MGEVLRLEVWCRDYVDMLLVAVIREGTYKVVSSNWTHDICEWLSHGDEIVDVLSRRPSALHTMAEFGVAMAAEKFAVRQVIGHTEHQAGTWERLYRGPLTMAGVPEDYTRWPTVRETMDAEAAVETTDEDVTQAAVESVMDFAARRRALKEKRKRARLRDEAHASLSDNDMTVVTARRSTALSAVGGKVRGWSEPQQKWLLGTVVRCRQLAAVHGGDPHVARRAGTVHRVALDSD